MRRGHPTSRPRHRAGAGHDPASDPAAIRHKVGIQLQAAVLPDRMRVGEAMAVFASGYRHHGDISGLLGDVGLGDRRRTAFGDLSGGQRQRLFIAMALLGLPEIVILDELTAATAEVR